MANNVKKNGSGLLSFFGHIDRIRQRVLPPSLNLKIKKTVAFTRTWPDYIIIGTMKGGTSSLYQYLTLHPEVLPADSKETHYFDINYHEGKNWYRTNFVKKKYKLSGQITGEASPYYIFHPLVAERIAKLLPEIKLIALFRNPTERAYSHYQHSYRTKVETQSFEQALKLEPERLAGEKEKMLRDPKYHSQHCQMFSYLARGRYAEQLKVWFRYFRREQFLILKSEDMFTMPQETMNKVFDFLTLPFHHSTEFKKYNYHGEYSDMPESIRKQLDEYFEPYNNELYELLGIDFKW